MKIADYLSERYGIDKDINANWLPYLNTWQTWYKGKVAKFHDYKVYTGTTHVKMERLSLQMAKKSAEDWADTIFNERVKIEVENETENKNLFDILQGLNFWEFMNSSVEQSGATGTGAVIVSVGNIEVTDSTADYTNSNINLDYISAENIYPISWSNGTVTECAFTVKKLIKGKFYLYLSVHHIRDNTNMVITNKIFKINADNNIIELDSQEGIAEDYDTGNNMPWFAIIKPAGINNIDPCLPFGLPYFANAIDVLKRIDTTFDSLQNEINLGRKRIFIKEEMTRIDKVTGESVQVFDSSDVSVYILPKGFDSADLIQSENSQLRIADLTQDLENSLALFGDKVGFGVQYYQIDPAGQTREIGILTQNSKMIRRKKKHEIVLESSIFDIVQVIMYASGFNSEGLKITFDNDIIDDENQRKETALLEVSQGIKSKAEYREEFYGEDEAIARKKIAEIAKESEVDYGIVDTGASTD